MLSISEKGRPGDLSAMGGTQRIQEGGGVRTGKKEHLPSTGRRDPLNTRQGEKISRKRRATSFPPYRRLSSKDLSRIREMEPREKRIYSSRTSYGSSMISSSANCKKENFRQKKREASLIACSYNRKKPKKKDELPELFYHLLVPEERGKREFWLRRDNIEEKKKGIPAAKAREKAVCWF